MSNTNMTIEQAAQVVLGAEPINGLQLEEARAVMFAASRQGYKFSTDNRRGSPAKPFIVITPPAAA
jgi:hypothetical protein